jgi:hypothetical protein
VKNWCLIKNQWLFALALSLLCLSFPMAKEGGKVRLELTESMVASLLTEALRGVDSAIRAEVNFKKGSKKDPQGQAILIYRVFISVPDLRLDSLDMVPGAQDTSALTKALEDLRSSLSSNGIKEVSFQVGTKMSLKKAGDRLFIQARIYPRTLRIHTKSLDDNRLDLLLNEVLRPLIVDRHSGEILQGIERKYLQELKVGDLFVLRAKNLPTNKLISIEVNLGKVNELNILDFLNFSTTENHLVLAGRTKVPGAGK